jgi:hypothetical protein
MFETFESDNLDAWDYVGTNASNAMVTVGATYAYNGTYGCQLKLYAYNGFENPYLWLSSAPGKIFSRATFWVKIVSHDVVGEYSHADFNIWSGDYYCSTTEVADWVFVDQSFSGIDEIYIEIEGHGGSDIEGEYASMEVWIDDITLYEIEPSTPFISIFFDDIKFQDQLDGFQNGDFEIGDLTGWSLYSYGPYTQEVIPEAAYESDYGLHLSAAFDGCTEISQQIDIPTILRFRYYLTDIVASGTLSVYIKQSGSNYSLDSLTTESPTGSWQLYECETNLSGMGTLYITAEAWNNEIDLIDIYIDDIELADGYSDPPEASFNVSTTTGICPIEVTFTDTSSKLPISWLWDFKDGATSDQQNPTHTFTTHGQYAVELTAINTAGSSSDSSYTITVSDSASADIELITYMSFTRNITDIGHYVCHVMITDIGHIVMSSITDIGHIISRSGSKITSSGSYLYLTTYLHNRLKRIKG